MSALEGHMRPGLHGAVSGKKAKVTAGVTAGVTLQEIAGMSLFQLAWFPEQKTAFEGWLKKYLAAGLPAPGQTIKLNRKTARGWILRPEPRKLWLLGLSGPLLAPARMADYYGLELTHGRCWLRLAGPSSADLLRRMAALDFSDAAFPPGHFAATAFDQVPVHLLRLGEGWLIGLPRSYALSCTQLIKKTSLQFGLQELAAAGQDALA